MKRILSVLIILLALCNSALLATPTQPTIDTTLYVDPINVTVIKQGLNLKRESVASTIITRDDIERRDITTIMDVAQIAPNLYIPDYGSRMTSSIYVRGLGARIDNPVIGLNVDNVPYLNKNAFDFDVMDIERMEILRGPQSTLYGRNTMGGVINVYTISPMNYQGIRLSTQYGSGNTYKLQGSLYQKHNEKFGTAIGLYYNSSDGFFTNIATGELCDWEKSYGARLKLHYNASKNFTIENTTAATKTDQGGYAYHLIDQQDVNYNDPSFYKRLTLSNGTTLNYKHKDFTLSSITAYQYLDDNMTIDNDFTPESYFTLTQAIVEHSVSQDLVLRTRDYGNYNALFGLFGFYKHQNMDAPVTFKDYGIEALILDNANPYFAPNRYVWDSDSFILSSDFINNITGAALYHESTYEKKRWKATAGIRLDYEYTTLKYHNYTSTSCSYLNANDEVLMNKPIEVDMDDMSELTFFEILPRFTFLYRLGQNNRSTLFASISKGYKAGGFNTQMFSDILQQKVMKEFGVSTSTSNYDTDDIITYKPEYSWNYEIGSHIESRNQKFSSDISLFYIDCRNQQLTVFPEGQTTGRMMTNAGRSRSIGVEATINYAVTSELSFNGSYGFTDARFIDYVSGTDDYAGNFVPYAPRHTLFAEAIYTIPTTTSLFNSITIEVNTKGAGAIYWNEDNSQKQDLYATLNSQISLNHPRYTFTLWGRNLTNASYNQFYFMSMGNEFVQSALPLTFGATLNLNFNI